MWRGGLGRAYPFAGAFASRCLTSPAMLRFHIPLIEPDVRISRIRLSDKDSRFRPREVAREHREPQQTERLGQISVGVAGIPPTRHPVLPTQPLARPCRHVCVHGSIGFADWAEAEVVRPTPKHAIELAHEFGGDHTHSGSSDSSDPVGTKTWGTSPPDPLGFIALEPPAALQGGGTGFQPVMGATGKMPVPPALEVPGSASSAGELAHPRVAGGPRATNPGGLGAKPPRFGWVFAASAGNE